MTVRYVGAGGNDGNSGTSWANRKLTINGCEDTPVVAGDTVYVGPGVYRELLTVDVSGTAGNPITYVADIDGSHTDGIGGVVRITGSDDDLVATRANCITATSKDYRTFTGFAFDTTTGTVITTATAVSNWIVQDCYFQGIGANSAEVTFSGTGTTNAVKRCWFVGARGQGVRFTHSSTVNNAGHSVENCVFVGLRSSSNVVSARVGGITVKGCTFVGGSVAVQIETALAGGQTVTCNNNIVCHCGTGFSATATGEITENYNALWGNATDRVNTNTGANSNAYPPLFNPQLLLSGFRLPNLPLFGLSEWSPLRAIAGTSMSADDLYGITRPTTDSKKSWGAVQRSPWSHDTSEKRTGAASRKLSDAGAFWRFVEVSNVSTTFSCYVKWGADYAGTKPRMTIRQPGQADTTVTATGSAGSYELLTTTLTPAASPKWVKVIFESLNTATSGAYTVNFDDFRAVLA